VIAFSLVVVAHSWWVLGSLFMASPVCRLGVVEVVVSDDCPLYSLMLKVLPALAMGNAQKHIVYTLFSDTHTHTNPELKQCIQSADNNNINYL